MTKTAMGRSAVVIGTLSNDGAPFENDSASSLEM